MQLHLVGGFLGSGKTTAIISAAQYLISQGKKVGVVTNDQGKYLVDTSFFQSQNIPTVEVSHGCFCCNYENLEEKLEQLKKEEQPDVIFAESVGSCSDIVATVIKPLLELNESKNPPTSFSVFTDSLLLLTYLQGIELPFNENVLYIFKKQIEEAKILVINKVDLLTADEVAQVLLLSRNAFPDKTIKLQNSKSAADITQWVQLISSGIDLSSIQPVEIDYERYGRGESELAWLDQELKVQSDHGNVFPVIIELIQKIQNKIIQQHATIGHLKFFIFSANKKIKVSIPTIAQSGWQEELTGSQGTKAKVLINARVQMKPEILKELISETIAEVFSNSGMNLHTGTADSFSPGLPHPTYRISLKSENQCSCKKKPCKITPARNEGQS